MSYTAEATVTRDGRNGDVRSSDGMIEQRLAIPAELGGPGGGTNPEQLFAAGYAGCFMSGLNTAARRERVSLEGATVTARISLLPDEIGFHIAAHLIADIPEADEETGLRLIKLAHERCPYSRAISGNVEVTLELVPSASVVGV